jgi:asparagine synthase (glutamine-hydrolysing)
LAYEPWWRFYQRQLERLRHLAGRVPVIGEHLWPAQANSDLVADMLTQGSSTAHERRAREVFASTFGPAGGKGTSAIRSLELLGYHLGTLLHRNDTMGMSASIEARFPFLDEALVETAVNLPYRYKIRFSPRAWEREHPLLRDKWVVRAVADRYMPKHLSKRKKWGFDVSAYRRMSIDNGFFADSFVADFLRMSTARFDACLDELSPALKVKFMMLEMWGQMFIRGDDVDTAHASLRRHAVIRAQS